MMDAEKKILNLLKPLRWHQIKFEILAVNNNRNDLTESIFIVLLKSCFRPKTIAKKNRWTSYRNDAVAAIPFLTWTWRNCNRMIKQDTFLKKLYANRFSEEDKHTKVVLWKVLVETFLQKYITPNASVLDIGGGYCEFLNHIKAKDKMLIDLNPDAQKYANSNIEILNIDILSEACHQQIRKSFDIIFLSNFLEHLENKSEIISLLNLCYEKLHPGGSLLIIQPNYKYAYREYYDWIDHHIPLTHLSLQELLQTIGFYIDTLIPKFLPYTVKGEPTSPLLLRFYLKIPLFWFFFGKQMFIKASKPKIKN